jgi:hypothetical protein
LDILYEMIHKRKKHSKMNRNKNKIPTKWFGGTKKIKNL